MFPKLQKKLVFLYTLSTGLILTLILAAAFLIYVSSRGALWRSLFQEQIFTLTSRLQTDAVFTDSYLAQMENNNRLLIYLEGNTEPFFFPGAYPARTNRTLLFALAEEKAAEEGIFSDSHPISSNLLQSSVFQISGEKGDSYLGNVLVIRSSSGYKKLILLQDISGNKAMLLKTGLFYLFIDFGGILLFYFTGQWFVRRSLRPLEETYRKQQDFVAAASHELRSPLAVIQTTADAIADAPAESARLLAVIRKECRRGSALVKNLLLLASADQGSWAVQKQTFELDELLLELLELYEPLCHARNGELLLELPEAPLPAVHADPDLCRQIFTILLDNAAAYGLENAAAYGLENDAAYESENAAAYEPETTAAYESETTAAYGPKNDAAYEPENDAEKPGTIRLQAEKDRAHVIVRVIDFGPGIPDAEKPLIFDRFYRHDRSRNKKEHFGLGLSIAAQLAEIQGITLEVQDTAGGGSTFVVRI